jgi:hypothetical protein
MSEEKKEIDVMPPLPAVERDDGREIAETPRVYGNPFEEAGILVKKEEVEIDRKTLPIMS